MSRSAPLQDLTPRPHGQTGPTPRLAVELATGFAALLAASILAGQWLGASLAVSLVAMTTYLVLAGLVLHRLPNHRRGLGWANRITLARGALVALLTGAVTDPDLLSTWSGPFAGLALVALLLDGLDGWVARRSGTTSPFGARFDMELDAFFILVLCLALMMLGKVGPWVLAIGTLRYAFVLAGQGLRWLTAPLPESRRRKAICVWQVATLMVCLLPAVDAATAGWLAATALAGLIGSFATDIAWLYRRAGRR
ncbi:CDP-alcohol phosphatidyltransferase family protein [Halomonas heilongjiangensis]|uniref:CDP-alcohol phosphatidyltransferase n=1 Tax=Halomonas heilongjiangensis TaxID=1387883 RepID=A0A2N7TGM5_9GAMM|nr:CDP-alcohol phosphatidyltransferase family protein [Halomonas heilongjiangensis]PMR67336.1 CDP-alcohol phosphatidyltransferase [Halomonas heilongjiangensis]PXX88112.1 CDP-alcohol phosphatidyltransferase [Halomonas heilongjiangensis]